MIRHFPIKESKNASCFSSCRIFFTRTDIHFARKCANKCLEAPFRCFESHASRSLAIAIDRQGLIAGLDAAARPLMLRLDPETAHGIAIKALARLPLGAPEPDDPRLAVKAFGLDFPNPIGLAAGFDKNGEAVEAALALGFGFTEVGTVTPLPQPGNPRPRLFRLDGGRSGDQSLRLQQPGVRGGRGAARARRKSSGRRLSASTSAPTRNPPTAPPITRAASPLSPPSRIISLSMCPRRIRRACAICSSPARSTICSPASSRRAMKRRKASAASRCCSKSRLISR